jgi:hypothetical protein
VPAHLCIQVPFCAALSPLVVAEMARDEVEQRIAVNRLLEHGDTMALHPVLPPGKLVGICRADNDWDASGGGIRHTPCALTRDRRPLR